MTDKQWIKELRSTGERFDDTVTLCVFVFKHYGREFTLGRAARIWEALTEPLFYGSRKNA